MPIPAKSLPQVATSWHEPALPAFAALYAEAQRRCSTQHGLPVTPSDEMRLRAWQLCWLALDAASAPANNLPEIADAQGWPPELVLQLKAAPSLPKLNTRTWQELRRARDQQLFAALPAAEPAAGSVANEALASMLTQVLAGLGLEQLRAWITPSVAAAVTRWLSAGLLAIDALALSDDNTDATALELIAFVHATLQREHGAVATAEDLTQSEPEPSAAASDGHVLEAKREPQAVAAAPEPPPVAAPAPSPAAAPADVSEVAAVPSVPEPAVIEQPPITSTKDDTRDDVSPAAIRPRRPQQRTIAQIAGVVAAAAVVLFMLRTSDDAPSPAATQPMNELRPRVAAPEPAPIAEPLPTATVTEPPPPQPTAAPKRPRFRNLAAAKRAHTAKKLDDGAYAAAIAELEAVRNAKIAKEQLELRSGKLSQRDYQRRVDAIDKSLGFDQR